MTDRTSNRPLHPWAMTGSSLLDGRPLDSGRDRLTRGSRVSAPELGSPAAAARVTVLGLALGALIVAAVISGSTSLMLLASLIVIAGSVVSPMAGLIALAFAAPLARPLVIPPPGLYAALGAAMLFGVLLRLPLERPRIRLPALEVMLLGAFLLYTGAHLMAGRIDGVSTSRSTEIASLFARIAEGVIAFGVAYVVLRGRSAFPVLAALLLSATAMAALGLTQLVGLDGAFAELMDPPGESGRITGVFANPNYFGAYLASMVALAVACAVYANSPRIKATLLALAALLSVTLVFTQSRGALVTVMAGIIAIAVLRNRKLGLLMISVLAIVAMLAYPVFSEWRFDSEDAGRTAGIATAGGRIDAWSAGGEAFMSSPLLGIGLGRFQDESPGGIAAHNWYVQVVAELGAVGIIIWVLFLAAVAMALRGRPPFPRNVGFALLVVLMVASLTMSPSTNFRLTGPILITIAAASAAVWVTGREASGSPTAMSLRGTSPPPGRWRETARSHRSRGPTPRSLAR